jgi:hypothetical protein
MMHALCKEGNEKSVRCGRGRERERETELIGVRLETFAIGDSLISEPKILRPVYRNGGCSNIVWTVIRDLVSGKQKGGTEI